MTTRETEELVLAYLMSLPNAAPGRKLTLDAQGNLLFEVVTGYDYTFDFDID